MIMEMKIAGGSRARRCRARRRARSGRRALRGAAEVRPQYMIPVPFDPRLISGARPTSRRTAMNVGVARGRSSTWIPTAINCDSRRDPIAGTLVVSR